MAAGAVWAGVPGYLQAKRGSHVVITTIMFNFIASALLAYLLVNVLKSPGNMSVESRDFASSAHMPGVHQALAWLGIGVICLAILAMAFTGYVDRLNPYSFPELTNLGLVFPFFLAINIFFLVF